MNPLITLASIYVIFLLIRPLLVLHSLLRMSMWRNKTRRVEEGEVPAETRDALSTPIKELERFGFRPHAWLRVESGRREDTRPRFQSILLHPEARTHAIVAFASTPDPICPWNVSFLTVGDGGRARRTYGSGERSLIGEPTGTIGFDPYAPTLPLEWSDHREALQAERFTPTTEDLDAALDRYLERLSGRVDECLRDGTLFTRSDGSFALSWRVALSLVPRVTGSMKKRRVQRASRLRAQRASLQPLPVLPLDEEIAAFERFEATQRGRPRASFLAILFAVTVPLFVLAGTTVIGSGKTAALVLAIVLFHELGHYLAMRACGYADTTIFFVPFLGGIAAGRKSNASVAERMFVLLAGPVPGLVLAWAVAVLVTKGPLREVALLAALVNLFNLLPILPLDGGQIAGLLVFGRHPWLDIAARLLSGIALILIGFAASGYFLVVLGVAALVQLPKASRQALLRRQFREARERWPDTPGVTLFFQVLRTTPLSSAPFDQKVVLARTTLLQSDTHAKVSWKASLGWLSAYGGALVGGGLVALLSLGASDAGAARIEPVTTVTVTTLPCDEAPTSPEANSVAPTRGRSFWTLAYMASFDSAPALENARRRLVADRGTEAHALGNALFVWKNRTYSEDDAVDVAGGTPALRKKYQADVVAAGGRFHEATGSEPSFDCLASDEASAMRIHDDIRALPAAKSVGLALEPPWTMRSPLTDAQRQARRTLSIAADAETKHSASDVGVLSTLWALAFGDDGERAAELARKRGRQALAVEEALSKERVSGHPLDEEVARLVIVRLKAASAQEREEANDALRARLGAAEGDERARRYWSSVLPREGAHVRMPLGYMEPQEFEVSLRPELTWMCGICKEVTLVAGERKGGGS